MDWTKLRDRIKSLDAAKEEYEAHHYMDLEREKNWWYLEGMIDVLKGRQVWDQLSILKPEVKDAYLLGREDAAGELDVL